MEGLSHYPLLVFALAFVALWSASVAGVWLRRTYPSADDEQNEHLGVILAATLTLLALIIGFGSMYHCLVGGSSILTGFAARNFCQHPGQVVVCFVPDRSRDSS